MVSQVWQLHIRVILSPIPEMQSAVECLPTGTDVDISIIPSQHFHLGNIAIPITQIRLLVVAIMLSEAFFTEGSRQHVVEEAALFNVDVQNSSIRFCRKDGIERFS